MKALICKLLLHKKSLLFFCHNQFQIGQILLQIQQLNLDNAIVKIGNDQLRFADINKPQPLTYQFICQCLCKYFDNDSKNNSNLKPGEIRVSNNKLLVGCKNNLIEILKLKPESKSILSGKEFINGFLNKKQNKIIFFD